MSVVEANWYVDPADHRRYRYWDGYQWTSQVTEYGKKQEKRAHLKPLALIFLSVSFVSLVFSAVMCVITSQRLVEFSNGGLNEQRFEAIVQQFLLLWVLGVAVAFVFAIIAVRFSMRGKGPVTMKVFSWLNLASVVVALIAYLGIAAMFAMVLIFKGNMPQDVPQ